MANGHGGARTNAGRPRLADKFAEQIAATEAQIGTRKRLSRNVRNLQKLANGGYLRVKEEWKPAGLVFVDEQATQELEIEGKIHIVPIFAKSGAPVMVKVRAFPDLPPDSLVCVSKTRELADPDRAANEYLINRILGKPAQDLNLGNAEGGALKIVVEYPDAGDPPEDPPPPRGASDDPPGDAPV